MFTKHQNTTDQSILDYNKNNFSTCNVPRLNSFAPNSNDIDIFNLDITALSVVSAEYRTYPNFHPFPSSAPPLNTLTGNRSHFFVGHAVCNYIHASKGKRDIYGGLTVSCVRFARLSYLLDETEFDEWDKSLLDSVRHFAGQLEHLPPKQY